MAKLSYLDVLAYLEQNWPEKVTENFIIRTEEVLGHVRNSPNLYIYSNEMQCYKSVIVKQVSLFYRVTNNKAELLVFWDNRQDPAKLLYYL